MFQVMFLAYFPAIINQLNIFLMTVLDAHRNSLPYLFNPIDILGL